MALLFGTPIPLLAGLENFPHTSQVGIFVHPPEKSSKPVQLPHLYQEGSSAQFRLRSVFIRAALIMRGSSSQAALLPISACFHCFNPSKGPCVRIPGAQAGLLALGSVPARLRAVSAAGRSSWERLRFGGIGEGFGAGTFHWLCS